MPPPTNTSAATATPIASLPASVTQPVHDGGTTYTVWYAYTAAAEDVWIGVWGFGDLVTYRPRVVVWLGPVGAPVQYLGGFFGDNVPIQVPVTGGTTYYFEFRTNSGNPSPAVLTLSVMRGPALAVPAGSIAVNDDTEGFPLVFLSGTTGAVLRAVHPFPAGEAGDTLDTGVVAVSNLTADQVAVYSPALALVGTQPHPGNGLFGWLRAHRSSETFYVGNETTGQIRTVTAAGAFGPTTWTTGSASLPALAVNGAQTLAYYATYSDNTVKTWQLGPNTAGGTFHAFPGGMLPTDILVLTDDTVLIGYTTTTTATVVHLSAAGAVLHTYPFTDLTAPFGTRSRLATALEDPAAFWIWTHHPGGLSRFRKIQISDGVELTAITTTEYETGVYQPDATATPVRFGHSISCPFWIVRDGMTGPPPVTPPVLPPGATLTEYPIRRLRRAPHIPA